jgi:phage gpG-like protein
MERFVKKILTDIKVELVEEFDKNFERKSFFSQQWERKQRRNPGAKGETMMGTGALRRSIRATLAGNSIVFTSSLPYASILNEGGTITVTEKMKKFFWRKYYEKSGAVKYKKNGKPTNKSELVNSEAEFWRAMALKKTGSKITIEARQFIGDAPEVHEIMKRVMDENLEELKSYLKTILKQKK